VLVLVLLLCQGYFQVLLLLLARPLWLKTCVECVAHLLLLLLFAWEVAASWLWLLSCQQQQPSLLAQFLWRQRQQRPLVNPLQAAAAAAAAAAALTVQYQSCCACET
jgi:hypothetical protein